ncbi:MULTISPECIES: NapC/NirT family cytochrome c [Ectothiorhodospira]|uniref:NapC/NirT family cytochrome c n=1 Tax=Ectothiorhodospira TaxID=1051 RepID=UPI00024A87AD|nr:MULTISPECIES: NapC/NirT family cytochrome c [Ectothiorhodospira]EHQ52938.1 hypothetical protein ECTPHS_09622 [Ectothiorhodospira sp. PHS-1]MCG5513966.1 NapC/NirT family cytochrome c [Ectothiorhodospira shaposhnikovii]
MGKLWITLIILLALGLVVAGGVGGHHVSTQNDFCITCHAYEKVSWDHGSHPQVDCLACHTKGFVTDKIQGARKVYLMFSGQVNPHHDAPSQTHPEKISENCSACHLSDYIRENDPDFYREHTEIMAGGRYTCLTCHGDNGHDPALQALRFKAPRYTQ